MADPPSGSAALSALVDFLAARGLLGMDLIALHLRNFLLLSAIR